MNAAAFSIFLDADEAAGTLFEKSMASVHIKFFFTNRYCPPGVDCSSFLSYLAAVKEKEMRKFSPWVTYYGWLVLGVCGGVYLLPQSYWE